MSVDFTRKKPKKKLKDLVVERDTPKIESKPKKKRVYKPRVPMVSMKRDSVVRLQVLLERVMGWKRFDPLYPDNVKHNRQEPMIIKELYDMIKEVLK